MVQRRVGQHHAELAQSWRDSVGQDPLTLQKQDRRPRRRQQLAVFLIQVTILARIAQHHSKRLPAAALSLSKLFDSRAAVGIAGKLEPAQPFDRHDAARYEAAATMCSTGVESCGPQSGQAFGSAWKRRSEGFRIHAWHAAHIVNRAIVVLARSYGTRWVIE